LKKSLLHVCCLACFLLPLPGWAAPPAWGATAYPGFYSVRGMDVSCWSADKGWTWASTADLFSVEAEPNGTLLFAGGPFGVFLLKEELGVWQEAWTWETLGFKPGDITSAVAAERDPYGRVNLVLAAEPGKSRIFLAEARSHQVKIRWEHICTLPPHLARVCPDTGNFLVLSGPRTQAGAWSLEEVDFRQDKTVWSLPASCGVVEPYDALRLRSGWTVVSDLSTGSVSAFDAAGRKKWGRALVSTVHGPLAACPLAMEKTKSGTSLLVVPSGASCKALLYRLDAATGEVIGRWAAAPLGETKIPVSPADAISSAPSVTGRGR